MPTLADLRKNVAPSPKKPSKQQREVLVADLRSHRRPTEFVEQKLLAALQRPSCNASETAAS
jgi:hypothetical protein